MSNWIEIAGGIYDMDQYRKVIKVLKPSHPSPTAYALRLSGRNPEIQDEISFNSEAELDTACKQLGVLLRIEVRRENE